MASYLDTQLDFITFFYGLAFVLLGGLCLVIAQGRSGRFLNIHLIGLFGCLHGATEWMDMVALTVDDSGAFAVARAAAMTLSFVLLVEFARSGALRLGVWMPGSWIYLPLLLLLCGVGYLQGVDTAKALARYGFGATGAFGTGSVLFARRGFTIKAVRPIMVGIAAGFWLYAVAAGVIVEPAPFWPADVVNQAWLVETTGVPIQLVRGLIAVLLAVLVWGAWGRRLMQTFESSRYSVHLKGQFFGVLATMAAILVFGWVLTNVLGGIRRDEIEREAAGEADLLVSGIIGAFGTAGAMVKVLAGSPSIALLLASADEAVRGPARAVLDLHVGLAGASRGLIVDRAGNILDSSNRHAFALPGATNQRDTGWFAKSIGGGEGHKLEIDPVSGERSYLISYPVRGVAGSILGVVALELPLEPLDARLRAFGQAFFLLDTTGVVVLTNRPSELLRSLWPRSALPPMTLAQQLGARASPFMLRREIFGGEWTSFCGRHAYVLRRPVGDMQWSLVLALPVAGLTASRLLGIIITLQLAIGALFYFFGRERGIRDRVQRLRRVQLQDLAQTLARQAATDPLTGLSNRLRFNERLEQELARARRTGRPFSLVMYDVDHFKEINDLYGHPTGDRVLIRMSKTIAANVRQTDLLARWGGEEFAVLLTDTDAAAASEAAEKLRLMIAHMVFDQVGMVTCSFGVAEFASDDSAESMVSRVDNALYRAKLNGRNRVERDTRVTEPVELSPTF